MPVAFQDDASRINTVGSFTKEWNNYLARTEFTDAYTSAKIFGQGANRRFYQDIKPPEKRYEPTLSFSFSNYDNLRASVMGASRSGAPFSRLPHGYSAGPNDVPRGQAIPRITDMAGGDFNAPQDIVTGRVSSSMQGDTPMYKNK